MLHLFLKTKRFIPCEFHNSFFEIDFINIQKNGYKTSLFGKWHLGTEPIGFNTFKYHMHPEYKDTTGFLFLYPSEFDIVYYHGAEENLNIHRHTSCVLTDLTVNYSPNGVFNTFSDGMPTEIAVQMNFKELTILTKELIQDGL